MNVIKAKYENRVLTIDHKNAGTQADNLSTKITFDVPSYLDGYIAKIIFDIRVVTIHGIVMEPSFIIANNEFSIPNVVLNSTNNGALSFQIRFSDSNNVIVESSNFVTVNVGRAIAEKQIPWTPEEHTWLYDLHNRAFVEAEIDPNNEWRAIFTSQSGRTVAIEFPNYSGDIEELKKNVETRMPYDANKVTDGQFVYWDGVAKTKSIMQSDVNDLTDDLIEIRQKLQALAGSVIRIGNINISNPTQKELTDFAESVMGRGPEEGWYIVDADGIDWIFEVDGNVWRDMGQNQIVEASPTISGVAKLYHDLLSSNTDGSVDQATVKMFKDSIDATISSLPSTYIPWSKVGANGGVVSLNDYGVVNTMSLKANIDDTLNVVVPFSYNKTVAVYVINEFRTNQSLMMPFVDLPANEMVVVTTWCRSGFPTLTIQNVINHTTGEVKQRYGIDNDTWEPWVKYNTNIQIDTTIPSPPTDLTVPSTKLATTTFLWGTQKGAMNGLATLDSAQRVIEPLAVKLEHYSNEYTALRGYFIEGSNSGYANPFPNEASDIRCVGYIITGNTAPLGQNAIRVLFSGKSGKCVTSIKSENLSSWGPWTNLIDIDSNFPFYSSSSSVPSSESLSNYIETSCAHLVNNAVFNPLNILVSSTVTAIENSLRQDQTIYASLTNQVLGLPFSELSATEKITCRFTRTPTEIINHCEARVNDRVVHAHRSKLISGTYGIWERPKGWKTIWSGKVTAGGVGADIPSSISNDTKYRITFIWTINATSVRTNTAYIEIPAGCVQSQVECVFTKNYILYIGRAILNLNSKVIWCSLYLNNGTSDIPDTDFWISKVEEEIYM